MKAPRKIACQTQSAAGTPDSSVDAQDIWNQPFASDLETMELGNWIESGAVTTSPAISSPSITEHPVPLRSPSLHQTGGSGQDTAVHTGPHATGDAISIVACGANVHDFSACIAPLRSYFTKLGPERANTFRLAYTAYKSGRGQSHLSQT